MKLTRRTMTLAATGLVVITALVLATRPEPLDVETAMVSRGPLETTIDADGRTRVRQRYVIVAPVSGRVQRLAIREGAAVRAGDVVARIAPTPLDPPSVTQAQSRLDAARSLALGAAAQVRVARAELEQRQRDLVRARRLVDAGGVAPRVAEEAELAVRSAEETASGAADRLAAAEADVRHARAALAGADATVASPVPVKSPASGRVLRVVERSERIVAAGTPLLEIGDPKSLEIVVDVLSSDGTSIGSGDVVRLGEWSDASAEEPGLVGRVREVEPSAFTKVSALGVEEQRVNVIVDIDDPPAALGDGFRVEARIIIWSHPDVVTVPTSALVRNGSAAAEWSVFLVRNGRSERRTVRIGHSGAAAAEVLDGLKPGDEVVLFPSDQVVEGGPVVSRRR